MDAIVIEGRIPSKKNSVNIFVRNGIVMKTPSQRYRDWHTQASWQLKAKRSIPKGVKLAELEIGFYLPDLRKTDLTNKAESVMDLLVDNGILEDDNCSIVPKLTLVYNGIDRERPRAEIKIIQP